MVKTREKTTYPAKCMCAGSPIQAGSVLLKESEKLPPVGSLQGGWTSETNLCGGVILLSLSWVKGKLSIFLLNLGNKNE